MRKTLTKLAIALCATLASADPSAAQQSYLVCGKDPVPWINTPSAPRFNVTETHSTTGSGSWSATGNVTDNSTTNAATGSFFLTSGSVTIGVEDPTYDYNAGNFAGFVVKSSVISLNVLGSLTVKTYLNHTLQETKSAASLLAVNSSLISGALEVGFYTNKPFDRIELTATSSLGLSGYNVYYAFLRSTGSCTSPGLACNSSAALAFPQYPVVVDPEYTGVTGAVSVSAISNAENAVDNDPATYASIASVANVAGTATFAVKDVIADYPAGTYAGFDISNPTLLSAGALGSLSIATYKDGIFQEMSTGNEMAVGATLLSGSDRQKVGFATTKAFDEAQLIINPSLVSVNLGTTNIYGAIFRKFCPGPALVCNTPALLDEATHPVYINLARTGIEGTACALCSVERTANVIDGNAATAALINFTAGALTSGSISVRNALAPYNAGTYAGFEIENPALLDVSVLDDVHVMTYLNGALQDDFSGRTLLAGISTDLLGLGNNGRIMVGNATTKSFDEVRLKINQPVNVNLGVTKVYNVALTSFCTGTFACNSTYWLNSPDYPVYVDGLHTGTTGAVCAACSINNADHVISASRNDYARLTTVGSVIARTSLSVHDAVTTYPAGTITGFAIRDPNNFLQVSLFKTLRITTYNHGVLQESASGGQLLNLSAIIPLISNGTGVYNAGFKTNKPFDEIQISTTPLAGVIPVLDVFGAFVNTHELDSVTTGIYCIKPPLAEADHSVTILNTPVNGSLRTNDRDPQNQSLTYNTTPATTPAHGTVTINADGTYTYTPANGYTGTDTFSYTVCNASALCTSQQAILTVVPPRIPGTPNIAPIPQDDYSQTIVNKSVRGNAKNNDVDPESGILTYSVAQTTKNGTLTMNADGSYVYTPDSSFVGRDTAQIQLCDNGTPQLCAASQLVIDVLPRKTGATNDPPFAQDDVYNTLQNTAVTGYVLSNDSDPDNDPLSATVLDSIPASVGMLYFAPDGSFQYTPAANYTGSFFVRYTVCDGGTPSLCDTATLTISVQPMIGPDFTPVLVFDSTLFTQPSVARDFVLTVSELHGGPSSGQVVLKLLKPTAFTITYAAGTTTSNVNGSTAVQNSDWTFTENSVFVTCTLKPGITIAGNGVSKIGLSIARKQNTPANTKQNITATIVNNSGGDSNNMNNQYTINLTAQ